MSTAKKTKNPPPKQEENLFNQIINRYIAYWPLFALLIIAMVSAAYVYLRYATPKYEATATLLIKDEKKGAEDSKAMESLNMINTKKIIENEIEVLQSRNIMANVVKSLHLYAPLYQEGKIRTISGYTISPVIVLAQNPEKIVTKKKIGFKYDAKSGVIVLEKKQAIKLNEWTSTPYGILKFEINPKYEEPKFRKPYFFSLISVKDATKSIIRDLTVVQPNKLSSVISLSYKDESPERAEDILNEIILMYDHASVDEKNSMAKTTLQFVEDRLGVVAKDLDSIERTVQSYKAGSGASDVSTQGQLYLQNVSSNDQELGKINMQLAVLDQVDKAINSGGNNSSSLMPSTLGTNDPSLSKLIGDLQNKELEYEKLKKTVAENNPLLISLKDQINKIRPSIYENLQTQRKSLEASKDNLQSTNAKYNSMLSTIPQKEREILEISRDQNVKRSIYSFLLQKREESELSYAATLSDSRVINTAQSSKAPVSPNGTLILLGALLGAIAIGIVIITAKEGFAKTVLYRKDLESMTQIPVIGELAENESKESIVIEAGKRSFIAEEFRKIRVSLHFLGIGTQQKKILITSSIPTEGKSFIAANLAISNALTGKKVVLVDLDMHKPGLSKIFDKSPDEPGISDFLTGKKSAESIIHRSTQSDNLFFVSSGTLHESPSELLLNGKINEFVDYLNENFDMVILDTAPSVLITDAFVLTELCDATLYVVRHKFTPKMLIKRIDENMEVNPLKNPGIIFNGVKKRGFFKNNYGYGYDYVYGKNYYGEETKGKKKAKK